VLHIGLALAGQEQDRAWANAADAVLTAGAGDARAVAEAWLAQATALLGEVAAGARAVKAARSVFFSIARGHTGVST
jgi:hypothetical protein